MNKSLGFQPRNSGNFFNFSLRQFTGYHHPAEPFLLQRQRPFFIMNRHLRTGMHFQFRITLPNNPRHAQVLQNNRIHFAARTNIQTFQQIGKFFFLHQRIDRRIHLASQVMRITDKFIKVFFAEIGCRCPRRKLLQPQINGICPVKQRRIPGFNIARRRQKFSFHGLSVFR